MERKPPPKCDKPEMMIGKKAKVVVVSIPCSINILNSSVAVFHPKKFKITVFW
jgi:hypothetical protein